MVDTKLADSIEEFGVSEITQFQPRHTLQDPLGSHTISQILEPIPEECGLLNADHM